MVTVYCLLDPVRATLKDPGLAAPRSMIVKPPSPWARASRRNSWRPMSSPSARLAADLKGPNRRHQRLPRAKVAGCTGVRIRATRGTATLEAATLAVVVLAVGR